VEIYPEFDSYRHESLCPLAYLSIRDGLTEEESRLELTELMSRPYHTIDTRYHIGELVEKSHIVEEELLSWVICPASHVTSDTIESIVCRREIRESYTAADTESIRWLLAMEKQFFVLFSLADRQYTLLFAEQWTEGVQEIVRDHVLESSGELYRTSESDGIERKSRRIDRSEYICSDICESTVRIKYFSREWIDRESIDRVVSSHRIGP
jgi:hypothetical protein